MKFIQIIALTLIAGASAAAAQTVAPASQTAPAGVTDFVLHLKPDQVTVIGDAITYLPKRVADPLLMSIQKQINNQLQAKQKADAEAKAKAQDKAKAGHKK